MLESHHLAGPRRHHRALAALGALLLGLAVLVVGPLGPQASGAEPSGPVRLNTGGAARTVGGVSWAGCLSASTCGGMVTGGFRYAASPTPAVTGAVAPADAGLYQDEWTGGQTNGVPAGAVAFSFAVPVQPGDYRVRLHFAENVQTAAGRRVFDVDLEGGADELSGFDIYASAGGKDRAIVRELPVTVTDGTLTIDFVRRVENAKVSGIEVLPAAADAVPPAAPAALTATASPDGARLDWPDSPEPDLAGYRVRRSTAGGPWTLLTTSLLTASSYVDAGQPAGTSSYVVEAVDRAQNASAPSPAASATREATPPVTSITWTTGALSPIGRHEASGAFAADGRLYVFGGYTGAPDYTPTRRVDAYDPATDTWTRRRDLPTGLSHAGVAVDGRSVYLAGGYPQQADGTGQTFSTTAVWRYDTVSDTYTALPPLPLARGGGALVLEGRTLHVFGGSDSARRDTAVHHVLRLDGGTAWTTAAPLPVPRNHLGGAALGGKVYAVAGQTGQDAAGTYRAQVHVYDPATDTWTAVAGMPRGQSHNNASTFAHDGRIVVIGGEVSYGSSTREVHAYDPAGDRWTRLTDLPAARNAGVAGTWGGQLFHVTGSGTRTTYEGTPHTG